MWSLMWQASSDQPRLLLGHGGGLVHLGVAVGQQRVDGGARA
jgi:hypothetical protein